MTGREESALSTRGSGLFLSPLMKDLQNCIPTTWVNLCCKWELVWRKIYKTTEYSVTPLTVCVQKMEGMRKRSESSCHIFNHLKFSAEEFSLYNLTNIFQYWSYHEDTMSSCPAVAKLYIADRLSCIVSIYKARWLRGGIGFFFQCNACWLDARCQA